jgi:2-aminoethylphosphonate transport system substrate-binding protein
MREGSFRLNPIQCTSSQVTTLHEGAGQAGLGESQMMKMKLPRAGSIGRLAPVLVLAMALGGLPPSARADDPPVVHLYSVQGLEHLYEAVLPAFEKKEGVTVKIFHAKSSGDVLSRVTSEKDAPGGDVIVTLPPFVQRMTHNGLVQPYMSPNYKAVPANDKAPDGAWSAFVGNYFSFGVNPEVMKQPPKTFADLLNPDYRVAYSNPEFTGDGTALITLLVKLMGEDKAFAYLKQLETAVKFHTKNTPSLDPLLSLNKISVANNDIQTTLNNVTNGLPVKPVFIAAEDGGPPVTVAVPYFIALVKNGANQEAGKKLIDYLMSEPVQEKVTDVYGIPARSDVGLVGKNGLTIRNTIAGVKVLPIEDWYQVMDKRPGWIERWKKEVVGNSGKQTDVVAQLGEE